MRHKEALKWSNKTVYILVMRALIYTWGAKNISICDAMNFVEKLINNNLYLITRIFQRPLV